MRFRRRPFGKRPRDPVFWTRPQASFTALGVAGPVQVSGAAIFSGTVVDAGIDQRLTLRRLKLYLIPGSAATYILTSLDLAIRWEIVLVGTGQPLPANLAFTTAALRQRDILAYGIIPVGAFDQPSRIGTVNGAAFASYHHILVDVKAMRKVDEDQNISVNAETYRASAGAALNANDQLTLHMQASVLFSRTKR